MTFDFKPAREAKDKVGVFVALTGTSNSGKTYSALELATGLAGNGKIAVLDTEGGRTHNLKHLFEFDSVIMGPPFRPHLFAEAARSAEGAGYACLLIDSFSQEWIGEGGVLDWHDEEAQRLQGVAAWAKPKAAHKAMVTNLLQRRIPIVFSIRGEKGVKPGETKGSQPIPYYKSLTGKDLPFEMTIAFRLDAERKGYIDLSDASTWKLEGAHADIFKHGERLSRAHGEKLRQWWLGLDGATGSGIAAGLAAGLASEGAAAASRGLQTLQSFWGRLSAVEKHAAGGANKLAEWKKIAAEADRQIAAEEGAA
jgi:hypothetical protein